MARDAQIVQVRGGALHWCLRSDTDVLAPLSACP